ncbi:TetR/AcrR family transcriptional regulator [Kitasatospora sp. McL0602]|uniref:TetR/AcrR family transcriptional regulator n=1 Tax=Kitasatospora sp. McL0602 TaxID=3439530 RepID=UPI003F898AD2
MARAGLTTERVVLAAAELADTIGFDNVTVSAVARGFGVKDASLYSHIRNLQDLRTRIAVLAATESTERITLAVAGRSGRDALTAFADAYRDYALAHPGRYAAGQVRIDLAATDLDLSSHLRAAEVCYAVLRAYGLAEPDLTDAARMMRSTFHGFVTLEAANGFAHSRPVQASWEQTVAALHLTLQHWPSQA